MLSSLEKIDDENLKKSMLELGWDVILIIALKKFII